MLIPDQRCQNIAGTPEFMAPEVIDYYEMMKNAFFFYFLFKRLEVSWKLHMSQMCPNQERFK